MEYQTKKCSSKDQHGNMKSEVRCLEQEDRARGDRAVAAGQHSAHRHRRQALQSDQVGETTPERRGRELRLRGTE
eukprot:6107950-Heterocapsa_arctica.AAC.1